MERSESLHKLLDLALKSDEAVQLSPWNNLLKALIPLLEIDFQRPSGLFNDYISVSKANAKGKLQHRGSDDLPIEASLVEKELFLTKTKLRRICLNNLGMKLLPPAVRTLEIGPGLLDETGESFLTAALPMQTVADVMFCDINPELVNRSKERAPQAEVVRGDLLNLTQQFSEGSFEQIIGHNTLDTIDNADLPKVLQSIFGCLNSGGSLIHFMSLEPFLHAFLHDTCKEEMVAWPLKTLQQHGRRFCLISKRIAERLPKKWPPEVIAIWNYLCHLKPIEQERFWSGVISLNLHRALEPFGEDLIEWGVEYSSWKNHRLRLEEQLRKAGFLPAAWDWEKQSEEIPLSVPTDSQWLFSVGPWGEIGTALENRDKSLVEVSTCAIIARKPLGGNRVKRAVAQRHFPAANRRRVCVQAS